MVLVLGGVGIFALLPQVGKNLVSTVTKSVATPTPQPGPSGSPIVPQAAAIITSVQVASAIDSYYHPTHLTNTVAVGETLYITFDLHLNGRTGYVQARFYRDREFIDKTELTVDQPGYLNGAVYATFTEPIKNGAAELYWCQQSDCSDGKLAAVAHFTITAATSNRAAPGQSVTVDLLMERERMLSF